MTPREGLAKGKLLFELKGYKLKGMWTLVKLKKGEKEWLLIKERDGYVEKGGTFPPESVLSGLSVERLRDSAEVVASVTGELERRKVRKADLAGDDIKLMLCETRDEAVHQGRLGVRAQARRVAGAGGAARHRGAAALAQRERSLGVVSRGGAVAARAADDERAHRRRGGDAGRQGPSRTSSGCSSARGCDGRLDIRRAAVESPATLYAFDLPSLEGYDLRTLPLVERKALLARVVPPAGPLRYLDHIETQGEAFFAQVERMGLEGIIAKKAESLYKGGRTPAWLKIKAARSDDFVVVGFTAPKGSRAGFGALHLAQYVGQGTGVRRARRQRLRRPAAG